MTLKSARDSAHDFSQNTGKLGTRLEKLKHQFTPLFAWHWAPLCRCLDADADKHNVVAVI